MVVNDLVPECPRCEWAAMDPLSLEEQLNGMCTSFKGLLTSFMWHLSEGHCNSLLEDSVQVLDSLSGGAGSHCSSSALMGRREAPCCTWKRHSWLSVNSNTDLWSPGLSVPIDWTPINPSVLQSNYLKLYFYWKFPNIFGKFSSFPGLYFLLTCLSFSLFVCFQFVAAIVVSSSISQ